MTDKRRQTTVVVAITIEEVEKECEHILSTSFTAAEKNALAPRHIRSTAGWFVLKKALCRLLDQLNIAHLSELDFSLVRSETGRPCIENINIDSIDEKKLTQQLFVSITHTRTTAYGMAVYQE